MGDGEKTPLKLNFDPKVRLEFRGATIVERQRKWDTIGAEINGGFR